MPNLNAATSSEQAATFPAPPSGPLTGKRLLHVDDLAQSTRMIRLAMTNNHGMVVREVNDPTRAIAAALEFRPDVILLDFEMPGMTGGTLWTHFRAHPEFRKVPVVFLTSRISEDEASPNRRSSPTHMLAKPVSIAQLTERLLTLLVPPPAAARPAR